MVMVVFNCLNEISFYIDFYFLYSVFDIIYTKRNIKMG